MSAGLDGALSVVAANPLLDRLASASIDLVVVTAIVALVVAFARIRSRRVIALLWLVTLAKPAASLALGTPAALVSIEGRLPALAITQTVRETEVVPGQSSDGLLAGSALWSIETPAGTGTHDADNAVDGGTVAVAIWLLGLAVMLGASMLDRRSVRRVVASSRPAGRSVTALYERVAASFRPGRKPRLLVTPHLESPALAGSLRPVILIPEWLVEPEQEEQLEWSLRHELSHWASRDPLANLVAELSRALLFFHPVAWWAARKWKEAMELACDEKVVSNKRDVRQYAEQLYQIMARVDSREPSRKRLALTSSLFATRTQIGRRIETLLRSNRRVARPGILALGFLGVFAAASFAVGADFVSAPIPPEPPTTPRAVVEAPEADGRYSYNRIEIHSSTGEAEVHIEARGRMKFTGEAPKIRIEGLSPKGYLVLTETTNEGVRRVKITRTEDGELDYDYRVDDHRAEWDDDAQQWLARLLLSHLKSGGPELIMEHPAPVPVVEPAPRPVFEPAPRIVVEPAPRTIIEPVPAPAVPVTE